MGLRSRSTAGVLFALVLQMHPRPASAQLFANVPIDESLPCLQRVARVTWMRWDETRTTLDLWCRTVGPPLAVDARVLKPGDIKGLWILSWNVHVGGGRVEELLPRLLRESSAAGMGLIVLLQETFRAGEAVPGSYPSEVKVPASVRPRRPTLDIRAIAEKFQMTMAYVPSMRNGPATSLAAREDRGNAVLSTERLTDITAIELPFGRERRVAVAAMVLPQSSSPRAGPLRVISAHFDPWDDRVAQSSALSERITYLTDVPIVIGGDLNAREGPHDGAVAALTSRIPLLSCGTGRTNRWPLRVDVLLPFVGRLDYMFATTATASGIQRTCETRSDAYGSDHLPLLLTMQY